MVPDCMSSQESKSGFAFSRLEQIYKEEHNGGRSLVHEELSMVTGNAYGCSQINFGEFI